MTAPNPDLKKTPLNAVHHALKAKMVDFGGWEMPVEYPGAGGGLIAEHMATRTAAGLFDVSHMGEIRVFGAGAQIALEHATMNEVGKLQDFQIQYSALLTPGGGFVDDILVYRFGLEDFLLVVNAANIERDVAWMRQNIAAVEDLEDVEVEDCSSTCAQIALQGPRAQEVLAKLTAIDLKAIKRYWFTFGEVAGVPDCIVSRTGYTGEDGFEIYIYSDAEAATQLWNRILEAGQEFGVRPCGLGARNTLRLEAGMPLYGHEISEEINVFEAGLERWCKLGQGPFVGSEALGAMMQAGGSTRRLVGLEMVERGIARDGVSVSSLEGQEVGKVTSGSPAPFLKTNIALALLSAEAVLSKADVLVDVRGNKVRAKQVETPFYKLKK